MQEIYPKLFIGNQDDYESNVRVQPNWAVVHACKDPYHRQALGYTGRGAPKNHPEYLVARRDNHLILNLVDADDPVYIPKEIIDVALVFIQEQLAIPVKVLVHCNQGASRSPAIGMLFLVKFTDKLHNLNFIEAENAFRVMYPPYNPAAEVRGFLSQHWTEYSSSAQ